MQNETTITLDDGRIFPVCDGEVLPWTLALTIQDEEEGYKRLRTIAQAMLQHRPNQFAKERMDLIKDSFGSFGNTAKKILSVIEEYI